MAVSHGQQQDPAEPLILSRLTFGEVEEEIRRSGALIIPLGGCEPYTPSGALGIASACAEAIGSALSGKLRIPLAPVLGYGCSTPYAAFGGAAGVKGRTLTNFLCETLRTWYLQGFRTFVLIDGLYENRDALELAVQRMKHTNPDCTVVPFSLQRDERVRAFIGARLDGNEPGRAEYGMLSMAAFVDPALVREAAPEGRPGASPDAQRFRAWRKRGSDPQQFRKFFPQCSASSIAGRRSADFGGELFGYILQLLEEIMAPIIQQRHV